MSRARTIPVSPRECVWCGTVFTPPPVKAWYKRYAMFDKPECRMSYYRGIRDPVPVEMRAQYRHVPPKCKQCGAPMPTRWTLEWCLLCTVDKRVTRKMQIENSKRRHRKATARRLAMHLALRDGTLDVTE